MSEQKEIKQIVRISGVDLDGKLKVVYGLSRIRGVGVSFANAIVRVLGIPSETRIGYLSEEEIAKLEDAMRNPIKYGIPEWMLNRRRDPVTGQNLHLVGSDVDFAVREDIERMKRINSWKGVRHALGLKVRGQHTRTTGRKGRTVGVARKAISEQKGQGEKGGEKK